MGKRKREILGEEEGLKSCGGREGGCELWRSERARHFYFLPRSGGSASACLRSISLLSIPYGVAIN